MYTCNLMGDIVENDTFYWVVVVSIYCILLGRPLQFKMCNAVLVFDEDLKNLSMLQCLW